MKSKSLLFTGLALVFLSLGLKLFEIEWYSVVLIAGIVLKVTYLITGLLSGRLAGGRYLAMLFAGIAMVGAGGFLKSSLASPVPGAWIMGGGFLLKAVSIVLMVVVGRKRRMQAEKLMSQ
ncbi:hypothetical protein [Marinilabilia rubra]|uniref:Uncharacterized protein n=1 Tax=Marinilabilia rubra TaxID=2162893 RepID=A0A2U2B7F3_9BACT|nr:hypothetical protein [Marinilabilia rubra]PWD98985.1 hypothetical protein DDZ16_13330 [Marinilabilia rubra]